MEILIGWLVFTLSPEKDCLESIFLAFIERLVVVQLRQ